MIAGGNPPDIAWYAPSMIKEWYYGGLLEPLDDWLPQDIEELLPAIRDPSASDIIYDGKYYGMPFCLAGLGVIARKDIFAEAGYDTDDLMNWDWAKYKEIMAAVTKPDKNQYGLQFAFGEPRISGGKYWFLTNGLRDVTDFSNKEAYVEALQYSMDLFPYSPEAQLQWVHADTLTCYMNGVCSVAFQGSYFQGDIIRQAPEVMSNEGSAVLPYPIGPRMDDCMVPWYTVGWVMFQASRNKPEAAEVLHFLASREAVNEWPMNMAPKTEITLEDRVRASEFGEEVRWWLEDWYEMMEICKPAARPGYAPSNEINQIYTEVLLELYYGSITAEEAYEQLKAGIEPIVIAPGQ
jgi:multiple sugar transport system substrate-binding protein